MSSFLPNVIVTQALQNVQTATVRDTNDVGKKARKGLRRLYAFQHPDGGWGWWKDDETNPWMTAYVVDGLVQAERAGYEVDANKLESARGALKQDARRERRRRWASTRAPTWPTRSPRAATRRCVT